MKKTYLRKLAVTVEGGFATFLYISNILLIKIIVKRFTYQLGWSMCGFENPVSSLK